MKKEKKTSSRARQYCCFKNILAKKKKRKSKIQKLHVLYQKKYIVEKPSPSINLPKKTTTYVRALEKEESRNKINFLFFLPPFNQRYFQETKNRGKEETRKIHLILFSSIEKTFCRSKQNEKKKKEEKMQNDTSPSAPIQKTFIRRNRRRENASTLLDPPRRKFSYELYEKAKRKMQRSREDTCHPSQREHNEETKSRIACAISPDSKDVPCILKVRGDVVSSIWPFVSPRKYATMPALCAARLSSMFAK